MPQAAQTLKGFGHAVSFNPIADGPKRKVKSAEGPVWGEPKGSDQKISLKINNVQTKVRVGAKRKESALTRKLNKKGLREKKADSDEAGEQEATSDSHSICVVCAACTFLHTQSKTGASSLQPAGHMQPRMATNVAQPKVIRLLETELWDLCVCVITCHNVFNVWPKVTLLFPVWPRDSKRLDTPNSK